ncbi:MAG TPA: DUF1538 domain-containing protein [Clostridiales bacterium]|nr:DUF1538 domain-containing protein [Clostridiales bacterium]
MKKALFAKIKESLASVVPVAAIVLILSFTPVADFSVKEKIVFSVSVPFLMLGISLFNLGADMAMTPMGERIGEGLTKSKKLGILLSVGFLMGALITVAEPDLSVLAAQVNKVINGTALILTVGTGVGFFLFIGILKIVFKKDLSSILLFFYMILFSLCALLLQSGKGNFIPLAFDSGGVTTGPVTVPFIMALGVGIALTVGGKGAKENSFGLIATCSVGPVLAVIVLSLVSDGNLSFSVPDYSVSENIGASIAISALRSAEEIARSLALILIFFFILQFTVLKLPKKKIRQILVGIVFTFFGLVIFLSSVSTGFMPTGYKLGSELAKTSPALLVALSFAIGAVVVLAEPAVHVLNKQVEEITDGAVTKKQMTIALSLGVGMSIGLSVIRIIFGFSLLWYLIPGYAISLGLSFFVPKIYTAIAFDSGGVASGPLTSGFILPLAIGACAALNGEAAVLDLAFGIVAMVAMTPLITIQVLGFKAVAVRKGRQNLAMRRILSVGDEQIIYFR